MRLLLKILMTVLMLAPAAAQDIEANRPWEISVTGQIQALRERDGAAALAYSGAGFRATYQNPQDFIDDIERAGYDPIGASRAHSFGAFREVSPGVVVLSVELIGTDGRIWEAIYQVTDEPDEGWRIQDVMLRATQSIGI